MKKHLEFFTLALEDGWEVPEGYPETIEQNIINGSLDEENKKGTRTRLLRFKPGAFTTEPFEHDFWEEVFLFSGTLIVGGITYEPHTYACRPAHVPHGPFKSEDGCLLLEIHYYE